MAFVWRVLKFVLDFFFFPCNPCYALNNNFNKLIHLFIYFGGEMK